MTRAGTTLAAILSAVILAPLAFCVALPIGINEVKAVNWGLQYDRVRHPPGTERILLRQGIDKVSNGDNCDFVVFEARSYAAGEEASIKASYAQQDNPIDPRSYPLRPEFFVNRPAPANLELYESFYSQVARIHDGPYYMLEAWAVVESAPPLVDWRCP